MLSSKQRAKLRAAANGTESIGQIGKRGITPEFVRQTADALRARELIKLSVLETSPESPEETARTLAERTDSEVVFVIGRRFALYKPNPKKPVLSREL